MKNKEHSITSLDLEFIQNDSMMKGFYEAYIVDKEYPNDEEAFVNAHFFALATTRLKMMELPDLAELMGKRFESYISMLMHIGWNFGSLGSKTIRANPGLHSFLTRISYNLDNETFKVRKEEEKENG